MRNGSSVITSEVRAQNYTSQVEYASPDLVCMNRTHHYEKKNRQIDTFGPMWVIALADLPPERVSVRTGSEWLPLSGPCGFIAPPFSLIEWEIAPGVLTWNGASHYNSEALLNLVRHSENKIYLEAQKYASALAEKVKFYIDVNYQSELAIGSVAQEFNFSGAFMSREFKKVCSLSPVDYRHQLPL